LSQGKERGGNVNFLAGEASRRQSACAGQYRFAMPVRLRRASSASRDKKRLWREKHPAASLLAQASIASRCQFRSAGSKIGGW